MYPFDGGLNGDDFSEESYDYSHSEGKVTCKFCGCRNLKWVDDNGRWELAYTTGKLRGKFHICRI